MTDKLIIPGAQTREALDHQALADADAQRGTRRNLDLLSRRRFIVTPAKRARRGLLPYPACYTGSES